MRPAYKRNIDRLTGKEVKQAQPVEVAVLQVIELRLKNDAGLVLVGVQQRKRAARLCGQHRLDVRQNGRNAGTCRKCHIMLGLTRIETV